MEIEEREQTPDLAADMVTNPQRRAARTRLGREYMAVEPRYVFGAESAPTGVPLLQLFEAKSETSGLTDKPFATCAPHRCASWGTYVLLTPGA